MRRRDLVAFVGAILFLGGTASDSAGQVRSSGFGIGVGVGVGGGPGWARPGLGPAWGPGWGWAPTWGWGPGWAWTWWMPGAIPYSASWGNGLSLYGPPVPTGKPIPGSFGGGDSQFFNPPPLFPGWMYEAYMPISRPAPLPASLDGADQPLPTRTEVLPPPTRLDRPAPLTIEVRLPSEDAQLWIDGELTRSAGRVRRFVTPERNSTESLTYELRAAWTVNGLTTTHTKRVTGRPGEHLVVEFR